MIIAALQPLYIKINFMAANTSCMGLVKLLSIRNYMFSKISKEDYQKNFQKDMRSNLKKCKRILLHTAERKYSVPYSEFQSSCIYI